MAIWFQDFGIACVKKNREKKRGEKMVKYPERTETRGKSNNVVELI